MYSITRALNQLKNDFYTWAYPQFFSISKALSDIHWFLRIDTKTEADAQALINEVFYNGSDN